MSSIYLREPSQKEKGNLISSSISIALTCTWSFMTAKTLNMEPAAGQDLKGVNIQNKEPEDDLEESLKELSRINERQEKRVHYHQTRAQNLTIAFSLFLGLIFVAISHQPSTLQCKHWWVPFAITLLASVTYLMAFVEAATMFYRIQYQLDINYIHQNLMYKRISQGKKSQGSSEEAPAEFEIAEPDPVELLRRKVYIGFTISVMLVFTVIELYACRLLLCSNYF